MCADKDHFLLKKNRRNNKLNSVTGNIHRKEGWNLFLQFLTKSNKIKRNRKIVYRKFGFFDFYDSKKGNSKNRNYDLNILLSKKILENKFSI